MEMKRTVLYLIVAALGVVLWNTWIHDYPPQQTAAHTAEAPSDGGSSTQPTIAPSAYQPGVPAAAQASNTTEKTATQPSTRSLIHVKTDVLEMGITPKGGNILFANLPQYPVSLQEKNKPVQILNDDNAALYLAQSGVAGADVDHVVFTSEKTRYVLKPDQKALDVVLRGKTPNGLTIEKTYRFERDRYAVEVKQEIKNNTGKAWTGGLYSQITRRQPQKGHSGFYTQAYDGGAVSSSSVPYQKMTYKAMDKANLSRTNRGGWVAMQQQYFVSAWVPSTQQTQHHFYTHVVDSGSKAKNDIYVIGFVTPSLTLSPGGSMTHESTLYVGPEIAQRLNRLNAPGLDHTVDYGWLWPISKIIFWIMNNLHMVLGNWGWSIVFTTIIIKVGFYWFSAQSFRSMARMRELQPRIAALRERFGDDKQVLSRETMALYRKEKVNPLGGCLPMLIQVPVFIALYYMLMGSVELRQAPFIFWIHDLSMKDPYYVMPILMGISMFFQQRLTPSAADPTQQKVMMFLPVIFTVFFLHFPAGLVLYWLVNNCVQILQQWYVLKTYDAHKAKRHAKRQKKKSKR